ncbi:hypothetical protein B0H14DRAFT_2587979 [Mycena olivaceomarginata]|nr:hypothetical protein B0H14DRAFT_2587979 [Mycena olivaceomarginata]
MDNERMQTVCDPAGPAQPDVPLCPCSSVSNISLTPMWCSRWMTNLLLDKLETGSDYQRGLACLNSKEKILVEQLKALGGDSEGAAPAVSNKRKSAMFLMAVCTG